MSYTVGANQPPLTGNEVVQLNAPHGTATLSAVVSLTNNGQTISGSTLLGCVISGGSAVALTEVQATFIAGSVSGGLTATGSTGATALILSAQVNELGTVASGTGVALQGGGTAVPLGTPVLIVHGGASALQVYGEVTSDLIDGTSGSTGVALTAGQRCFYTPVIGPTASTGAQWFSGPVGSKSH
jgi:hypothetical protein